MKISDVVEGKFYLVRLGGLGHGWDPKVPVYDVVKVERIEKIFGRPQRRIVCMREVNGRVLQVVVDPRCIEEECNEKEVEQTRRDVREELKDYKRWYL